MVVADLNMLNQRVVKGIKCEIHSLPEAIFKMWSVEK